MHGTPVRETPDEVTEPAAGVATDVLSADPGAPDPDAVVGVPALGALAPVGAVVVLVVLGAVEVG